MAKKEKKGSQKNTINSSLQGQTSTNEKEKKTDESIS